MSSKKHVAFLRGINVGGHHKVPMADLRKTLEQLGFTNIITLLNSGNVIFDAIAKNPETLEKSISEKLEQTFGFPIPVIARTAESIHELFAEAPFKAIEVTKDIRLYISLMKDDRDSALKIPWKSPDGSFEILKKTDKTILSVLDLSIGQTPKAMEVLEKSFGKDITTRNWKTIERIVNKL